jgi:hypothetical protein
VNVVFFGAVPRVLWFHQPLKIPFVFSSLHFFHFLLIGIEKKSHAILIIYGAICYCSTSTCQLLNKVALGRSPRSKVYCDESIVAIGRPAPWRGPTSVQ